MIDRAYVVAALLATSACGRIAFDDACTDVPGLLAYFPMNDGDVAQTRLRDRSGHERDGQIFGAVPPAIGAGIVGSGLVFPEQSTSYIDVEGIPFPSGDDAAVTFATWVFEADASASSVIVDMPPSPRLDVWLAGYDDLVCINTANSDCWGTSVGYAGRWTHIAAILREGSIDQSVLFIDGERATTSCPAPPCTTARAFGNPMRLGASDVYALTATLDEVRLYERELSDDEVRALYSNSVCSQQ